MEPKFELYPARSVVGFGPGTVADRIRARITVLEDWIARKTIPPGQSAPSSLTSARKWSAPEIGIFPIYSPNDFTKSNPRFGEGVSRISELLLALSELVVQSQETNRNVEDGGESLTGLLQRVVSQWHVAQDAYHLQKSKAEAKEALLAKKTREFNEQAAEIEELRRQIEARKGVILSLPSKSGDRFGSGSNGR